jgi:hypothetical protein
MNITMLSREEAAKLGKQWAAEREHKRQQWIREELACWPKHLRAIGRVLFEVEHNLSDGYEYYSDWREGQRWEELVEIAEQLYQAAGR